MLCLKCVSQHAGHTIADFEDIVKTDIMPVVKQRLENTEAKLQAVSSEVERILNKDKELQVLGEASQESIQIQLRDLIQEVENFGI